MTLFMGSGEPARNRRAQLHRLLDEALDALGGTQQPLHWDHEPSEDELLAEEKANIDAVATMRSAVTAIATDLGQRVLLVEGLADLRLVQNKYNRRPEAVGLSLDHRDGGWTVTRDDQAGGGPWRRGPKEKDPSAAVIGFVKMVESGEWSPETSP